MTSNHPVRNSNGVQPAWYLAPLVWPAIAMLLFAVAPGSNDLPAEVAKAQQSESTIALSVAPAARVDEALVP